MNSNLRAALAALVLCGIGSPALGQETPTLLPGTRLRVTVARPVPQVQIARFGAVNDSSLVISRDAVNQSIPLTNISRLEWSSGKRPSVVGGVFGLIVGAAAGGVAACSENRDSYGVFCGGQNDTKVAIGTALGGLAGAAAGAFLFRRDQWRDIDPARLRPRRP